MTAELNYNWVAIPVVNNAEDVKKHPIPEKNSIDLSSVQFKEVDT